MSEPAPATGGNTTRTRLVRFGLSAIYVLLLSIVTAAMTKTSWLFALLVLMSALLATFLAILFLLVQWAEHEGKGLQVRLSSLLCVIFLLAIYLGLVRWFVVSAVPANIPSTSVWVAVFLGMGMLAVMSLPFLLMLGDTLLAMAVWLVKQPLVKYWLRARRAKKSRQAD